MNPAARIWRNVSLISSASQSLLISTWGIALLMKGILSLRPTIRKQRIPLTQLRLHYIPPWCLQQTLMIFAETFLQTWKSRIRTFYARLSEFSNTFRDPIFPALVFLGWKLTQDWILLVVSHMIGEMYVYFSINDYQIIEAD